MTNGDTWSLDYGSYVFLGMKSRVASQQELARDPKASWTPERGKKT